MTSVATNGSCVTMIMKISAGSSGARRPQPLARGGRRPCPVPRCDRLDGGYATAVPRRRSPVVAIAVSSASLLVGLADVRGRDVWLLVSALWTDSLPAIAELIVLRDRRCRSPVNSGMSTNWMPIVGRGCTPGILGSAVWIAVSVGLANAAGDLQVVRVRVRRVRLPAGTLAQPSLRPTRFS